MRKLTPLFLILAAFFLAALAATVSYEHLQSSRTPTGVVHQVALLGDHVEPALLTIKTGESVEFVVSDGVDHRMTNGVIDSGTIKPSENYRIKLDRAGNATFYDSLHPKIRLEIVIYDADK